MGRPSGLIVVIAAAVAAGTLALVVPAGRGEAGRPSARAAAARAMPAGVDRLRALERERRGALRTARLEVRHERLAARATRRRLHAAVRSERRARLAATRAQLARERALRRRGHGRRLLVVQPMRVYATASPQGPRLACPRGALSVRAADLNAAAAAVLLAGGGYFRSEHGRPPVDHRGAIVHAVLERARLRLQPPHACGRRVARRTVLVEATYPRVASASVGHEELWLVRVRGGWEIWGWS